MLIQSSRKLIAALACLSALAIAGCGGGGSSSPSEGSPVVPEPKILVIQGVAATGAAFSGGVVSVLDSRGQVVGTSEPVGDDGIFEVTLADGAVPPYVLVATRSSATGEVQTLVSVVENADVTTANVTPITTLIASRLSSSGDPSRLAEELASGQVQITAEAVAQTVAEVRAILEPLLAASGTGDFDPLRDPFATDGTGHDQLLDSIRITILPAETGANIEIAVKSVGSDEESPPTITFSSGQTVESILEGNGITATAIGGATIDAASLAEAGLSVRIADLLQRLGACYAVPFEQRVNGVTGPEVNAVVGTAADLIAPDCRSLFVSGDPALYRHNGGVVQRTASGQGSFATLFLRGATGVAFSEGSYEFTRANGDIVVGYKARDAQGGESFGALVVRSQDGVLRLIGNQYAYPGHVVAYQQRRNFITLGQQEYSYYSTGYTPQVTNLAVNGVPLFDRVEVITPRGGTLVLRPAAGQSQLVFYRLVNGVWSATGTSLIRLRTEYVDGSTTRPHPSLVETAALVLAQPEWTEEELVASGSSGIWRFDYFLAGNTGSAPDATQYYRSRSRALSIGELRAKGLAELVPALVADIQAGARPANDPFAGQLVFAEDERAEIATAGGGDGWMVLAGQMPPTSITLYGRYNGVLFNDSVGFSSIARAVTVPCSAQGQGDTHCFGGGPGYAAGAAINGLQLWSADATGREYANFYAMYRLNLP